jgi:cytochrome oxidase Cu insertion factor (SCO1/SenC/PrrC family)
MSQGVLGVSAGALVLALACTVAGVKAQSLDPRDVPPNEDRLVNVAVPDIPLTLNGGRSVRLSEAARGRPIVMTFIFTRCGGVCSPFLMAWQAADRALGRKSGYMRLVLSFDPRDTWTDVSTFARNHGLDGNEDWTFAVASPSNVRQLADAIGFWWEWDERRRQFDHPALLAGIRDGRLVRLYVGGTIASGRLDELVREISGEFVRSYPLPGRVPFRCVRWDPATGRMTLDWGFALLLVPVAVTSTGTAAIFTVGARRRKKQ